MAAPRRTEDHQETDQSSRSDSVFTPGNSTQEVKRRVAKKKDSGVGLFPGHEVSPTSGELETDDSKDPCEESSKHSPSSPKVSATHPRSTPKTTSNFIRNTPTPLPTTQINHGQTSPSLSTVDKSLGRKHTDHPTKSEPRTVPPVFLTSSANSPSFDEDSGEEGDNYVC